MSLSTWDFLLWDNKLKARNTDCTFVFKKEPADDKFIHAHKLILSMVSPYFETCFKAEWKGNEPIIITTVEYDIFEKMISAIYLSKIELQNLTEGLDLYEAAHFYQIETLLSKLQHEIQKVCYEHEQTKISQLIATAYKFEDYRLMEFSRKYFTLHTEKIIKHPDFLNFTPKIINSFFQIDDLSVSESDLVNALERYIEANMNVSTTLLRPAIQSIRFRAILTAELEKTKLLDEEEKKHIREKNDIRISWLSKCKNGRYKRSFFSRLSLKTQKELQKLFVSQDTKSKLKESFGDNYEQISIAFNDKYVGFWNLEKNSKEDVMKILKIFQEESLKDNNNLYTYFKDISDELNAIHYVF